MRRHIICERDVGLFSLVQQVIGNIPWALAEGRVPIAYFTDRTCYWTPRGYAGADTVWEYYFEPLLPDHPAASVPEPARAAIARQPPGAFELGHAVDVENFVSAHFGDHPALTGKTLPIPYLLEDPDRHVRERACAIMRRYLRPRAYLLAKVAAFFETNLRDRPLIGVHARGTDATSPDEVRPHRHNSLVLEKYLRLLDALLDREPEAAIFVATDEQAILDALRAAFGRRIIAYEGVRHVGGKASGSGPLGCIMPAYIAADRDVAARNGEEAVIDFLLLACCGRLIHNGSSLARTVLLLRPELAHFNTNRPDLATAAGEDRTCRPACAPATAS
jgi:hypothetical protein